MSTSSTPPAHSSVWHSPFGDFYVGRLLGKGSNGEVWLVTDFKGKEWALKIADVSKPAARVNTIREVDVLRTLRPGDCHPLILCIENAAEDSVRKKMYILTEFLSGPSFQDYIDVVKDARKTNSLTLIEEHDLLSFFLYVSKGIKVLHDLDIVHQDIKPANIVLKNEVPKLIDFGYACMVRSDDNLNQDVDLLSVLECSPSAQGSPLFCSPEKLARLISRRDPTSFTTMKKYYTARYPHNPLFANLDLLPTDRKAEDIWALGITFYTIANLQTPFYGCKTNEDVYAAAMAAPFTNPKAVFVPSFRNLKWLNELLAGTFNIIPKTRWTIDEIIAFLETNQKR